MMLFLRLRKVFLFLFPIFPLLVVAVGALKPVVGRQEGHISAMESTVRFLRTLVSLQCSDTVGWTTGMASGL